MSKKRMGIIAVVTLLVLISSNTCVAATKKKPTPAPAKTDARLLQDNCRRECEDLFQKKYAVDNKLFPHIDKSFSYRHHYNLKMNKCFMLIIETGSNHSHKRMKLIDNRQNLDAAQGAGIQSAQNVVAGGAQALVTGHCGPKAFRVLKAAGVDVYTSDAPTVAAALALFREGTLKKSLDADVEGHWA